MTTKICIIGDIHGRSNWKKIDFSQYEKIIVMGDYFDPYEGNISYDDRWNVFEELLELRKNKPEKWVLLFGNHDLHYFDGISKGSRYDPHFRKEFGVVEKFKELLKDGTLRAAYSIDDVFFVHASISVPWYNFYILNKTTEEIQEAPKLGVEDPLDLEVKLCAALLKSPQIFDFKSVSWDMYGYSPVQGPFWWRSFSPVSDGLQKGVLGGIIQVNGHTQVRNLLDWPIEENGRVVFVDGLGSNWYTELTIDGHEKTFKQVQIEDGRDL